MFNYDNNSIRGHKEIKREVVDETTKKLYKSQLFIYGLIKHRLPDMPPAMKKHFEGIALFIEGYEAGVIRHWYEFYKTTEGMKGGK